MNQSYLKMSKDELQAQYNAVLSEYNDIKAKGLNIDMSRGKPGGDQLDISNDMLIQINKLFASL